MSRILVTGGSRGIGAEIVAGLEDRGSEVLALSRGRPARGLWVEADLSKPEAFDGLAPRIGPLDAIVHCAGIWEAAAFSDAYAFSSSPPEEIGRIVAVNLTAPILLTRALLPNLRGDARIVLIGSTSGLDGSDGPEVAYAASKAGLRGAAMALQTTLGRRIAVTVINPGDVEVSGDNPGAIPVQDIVAAVGFVLQVSAATVVSEMTIRPMRVGT